jgi:hypothetical protein
MEVVPTTHSSLTKAWVGNKRRVVGSSTGHDTISGQAGRSCSRSHWQPKLASRIRSHQQSKSSFAFGTAVTMAGFIARKIVELPFSVDGKAHPCLSQL